VIKKISALFAVSLFSVSLLACGGGGDATCEGVGKHVVDMAKKELSGMDGDMKKMAEAMLGPLKDEIVKKCKEDNWSKEAMKCMVGAKTEKDFEKCEKLVGATEDEAPKAVEAPPAPPAPADDDGDDDDHGDHDDADDADDADGDDE
jgi:hypothetical protein